MDDVRRRLEVEQAHTSALLAQLTSDLEAFHAASRDTNADDEHDPEGSTIAFERSQLHSSAVRAQAHLGEVADALTRLSEGMYGVCRDCGGPIGRPRLEARPVAATCIRCASAP